jgi:hypothetical protein
LVNTIRLLKKGGLFRLVVPDLAIYVALYQNSASHGAAIDFMQRTGLGEEVRRRGLIGYARDAFGNARHRWMWDYRSLASELETAGFSKIRKASLGDSSDLMFSHVEEPARWENSLGIECARP